MIVADPQWACPVGGGVLVVTGDAGLTTSFPWDKPMGVGAGKAEIWKMEDGGIMMAEGC